MKSYLDNLESHLSQIINLMMDLLDKSKINYHNWHNSSVVVIAPEYWWEELDNDGRVIQSNLLSLYVDWYESLSFISKKLPPDLVRELNKTHEFVLKWIERPGSDWTIPKSIQEAKNVFLNISEPFKNIIGFLKSFGKAEFIIIPDTNSLIFQPDPIAYSLVYNLHDFVFIYIPTVLTELDELKIKHNNPDFRDKVKSVITRIKGYRNQGSLLKGVIVNKTISLKMIAVEPDFTSTLKWLDQNNNDDRIIASVLEIQRNYPSSVVTLVTSDINLQNKAEMAHIPYYEIS